MYYYIKGTLTHIGHNFAVVDAGGVGYKLFISINTHSKISSQLKSGISLFSYLAVREDALELYGFHDESEKTVFVHLLSVSGVGPKAAMSVISTLTVESFAMAIASGDAKAISASPGIGLKTAQKIIIELKDKIAKEISTDYNGETNLVGTAQANAAPRQSDAVNALVVLGYSRAEATNALKKVDINAPLEVIIREALKVLYN